MATRPVRLVPPIDETATAQARAEALDAVAEDLAGELMLKPLLERILELGLRAHVVHNASEVSDKDKCPHIDTIVVDSLSMVCPRFLIGACLPRSDTDCWPCNLLSFNRQSLFVNLNTYDISLSFYWRHQSPD